MVTDKSERVARFQRSTLESFREMVIAMGLENPWQIEPRHISERLDSARADSVDRIQTFLAPGQLLDDAGSTPYQRYWDAARIDSFEEA